MKMPQTLDFKEASTVTLGGIAMQGVRRADMKFVLLLEPEYLDFWLFKCLNLVV